MIQWKQRLYAFLLRRVLGPLLDASATKQLHDSIDVSLQEGTFVLKDISLNASYLTERLASSGSGMRIRRATIERLEIQLTLRENQAEPQNQNDEQVSTRSSSIAWRAMKLGSTNDSLPAVSLLAEVKVHGVEVELEPTGWTMQRGKPAIDPHTTTQDDDAEPTSKSIIGSYVEAALASLRLTLKVTSLNVTVCHKEQSVQKEEWVAVRVSAVTYKDLVMERDSTDANGAYKVVLNKSLDISELTVKTGERQLGENVPRTKDRQWTVALGQGTGHVYYRVIEYANKSDSNQENGSLQQDIEINLNHQLNFSVDQESLIHIRKVADSLANLSVAGDDGDDDLFETPAMTPITPSLVESPLLAAETGDDNEDLKAITGIMKQYREAYHRAEKNPMRGGILVPSHAYMEDLDALEEDDAMTFDVFFDANDQSFYTAASVLRESALLNDPSDSKDSVQTKLRMNLLSASLKVNFRDQNQHLMQPQEYVLINVAELSLSASSSKRKAELSLNVTHFEIEDAQMDTAVSSSGSVSVGGSPVYCGGPVSIGTLVGFVSDELGGEEIENDNVVSQPPGVTVHIMRTVDSSSVTSVACDVNLLPIEVCLRQRTLGSLATFSSQLKDEERTGNAQSPSGDGEDALQVSLTCNCPSLTVEIPFLRSANTAPLFNRTGEIIDDTRGKRDSLGLLLDSISIDWDNGVGEESGAMHESSGKFSCLNILVFAQSHLGDKNALNARLHRTDILLLSGRTEVQPYIPISIEVAENRVKSKVGNRGRDSFPLVPTISSFKARQEDEDEELKIDELLFSKLHNVEADTRRDLRGADPQVAMAADSEKCSTVVALNVPEVIVDLTRVELECLLLILDAVKPDSKTNGEPAHSTTENKNTTEGLCIAVNFDQISISVQQDSQTQTSLGGNKPSQECFSLLLAVDKVKLHTLFHGSSLRHIRLLGHDPCLYSAYHSMLGTKLDRRERGIQQRVENAKLRLRRYSRAKTSPIVYRSKLFTPISHDAPTILLDLRDLGPGSTSASNPVMQQQLHVTVYHLTFRYDVDSRWVQELGALVPQRERTGGNLQGGSVGSERSQGRSMKRVFLSVADCNVDYTSPNYFAMASRSVVRLGDFRFSSNIMQPAVHVQAYSLCLGDLSYHVSDVRHPYLVEDRQLCRSKLLTGTKGLKARKPMPSSGGAAAETVLREMGFVNVLSLDSMDAIVAVASKTNKETLKGGSAQPGRTTSLTFGLLTLNACKDSFNCFASTVGELQAKLTALSEEDLQQLRRESEVSRNSRLGQKQKEQAHVPDDDDSGDSSQGYNDFLLDGYEWTDIDHDPLRELEIPDGHDEIATWYSAPTNPMDLLDHIPDKKGFPGRVIHHHFPLHTISHPLSDGDMKAPKYAGEGAVMCLNSRIVIHKLSLKMRFFDGYDWPERLSPGAKSTLDKHSNFVIEPLPPAELAKIKQQTTEALQQGTGTANIKLGESSQRKLKLMADLLAKDMEDGDSPFSETPLPEERAATIRDEAEIRRLSRKTKLYMQVSAHGVTLRVDGFEESDTHRLASVLSLSVADLFIAETASLAYPVKMLGEWVNDHDHPRDTRNGTLMLKMITWKPLHRVTEANEIESDDSEITMQLLPMRAILDQRAINYIRAFFNNNESSDEEPRESWSSGLHVIPPPRFRSFRVKPWRLKVDYVPQTLDIGALREGSFVELINLSPIDGMVISLSQVVVEGVVGFGDVFSGLVSNWIREVVATQLHKFVSNARPFEPLTDVGQGVADLVVLPYDAFRNGDDIQRAMTSGVKSLAETVTFQALTTSSRLTQYAANKMAKVVGYRYQTESTNPLPARPTVAPKGVGDVTGHAMESLARGFQAANYKVVIVPYREYNRHGATGAASSVIRGIPVLLVAPVSGAAEALSYTLLGARNALRPQLRKEEEASHTGFSRFDA